MGGAVLLLRNETERKSEKMLKFSVISEKVQQNWSSKIATRVSEGFLWKTLDASRRVQQRKECECARNGQRQRRDARSMDCSGCAVLLYFEGCWRGAKMMRKEKQKRGGKEEKIRGLGGFVLLCMR